MRKNIDFNQDWFFSKENENTQSVTLPHTWNNQDGQDGGNDYWRGTATYTKKFEKPEMNCDERLIIEFKGAAMTAEVFLNDKRIAYHEGGYSTFRADMTDKLEEVNELKVFVDNGVNDHVYPQKADFTFYGGLYRNVNLILVSKEHFELLKDGMPGIKITPQVKLPAKDVEVIVETWSTGGDSVELNFTTENGNVHQMVKVTDGYSYSVITLKDAHLWDGIKDPYLYTMKAKLLDVNGQVVDRIHTRFGCRQMEFDAQKGFLLNGREYPLRGVSRHQDRIKIGNALTMEQQKEDMEVVREIGANTVRAAHYQQAQEFYDLCDEYGMIVWAEIPYITEHMPKGRANTMSQMRELVIQCYNHPSIACWGLSNEITASGTVTEDLMDNHRMLNDLCHELDETRPTTMAHVFMLEKDSPLINIADIGSYNLYFGWYLGELEQNNQFFDEYHKTFPNRVIGFSEYGADANAKFHSAKPERGDYTEEYQCVYHEHILKLIEERPYLWATHVWNLFDFAADGRDEGGKKGENQKGLVEFDHKTKKDAFYLYKAVWNKEQPFVHLCGKRYVDRVEDETVIKVYSNCDQVSLLVDGKEVGRKTGKHVFTFSIPVTGTHEIQAVADNVSDCMKIQKVESPNEAYLFRKAEVVNWFDKEDYKADCYSIKDTMGDLMKNPQSGAILSKMMERMSASRGDVAKSANGNANLQKMMAGMSLESLIKQAGDSVPEQMVKQLNATLQQIKK